MLNGNISNKPALSVVILLDDIADKVSYQFLSTKVKIEIHSRQSVDFLNRLFLEKDVRIIVACLMDKKHQNSVEQQLDEYKLLFSELVFATDMTKLINYLNDTDTVLYTSDKELLTKGYRRVTDLNELLLER